MVKIHTISMGDKICSLGYKVVTNDLKSLGLRRNPNIIQYPMNEWYFLQPNQTTKGPADFGGIWVARTLSGARGLKKYVQNKHARETKIFAAALDEILYFNDYRIKTNGINMIEEISS